MLLICQQRKTFLLISKILCYLVLSRGDLLPVVSRRGEVYLWKISSLSQAVFSEYEMWLNLAAKSHDSK